MIHSLKKDLIYTPDGRLFAFNWQTTYAVVYQVFHLFFFRSMCLELSFGILACIRLLNKGLPLNAPTTKNIGCNNYVVLNHTRFIVAVPLKAERWES